MCVRVLLPCSTCLLGSTITHIALMAPTVAPIFSCLAIIEASTVHDAIEKASSGHLWGLECSFWRLLLNRRRLRRRQGGRKRCAHDQERREQKARRVRDGTTRWSSSVRHSPPPHRSFANLALQHGHHALLGAREHSPETCAPTKQRREEEIVARCFTACRCLVLSRRKTSLNSPGQTSCSVVVPHVTAPLKTVSDASWSPQNKIGTRRLIL